ncbi:hypothetical protein RN001_011927 [Aquatica leii]|uniref:Peptidase S1 domain-containing protein n=1 Tax=Aquatica leii TaxID=1421715 RepID=A0AAN7SPA3_9COLE|nr:hypothetical protein RN001_011927 [Aquatica leii]
MNVCSILLFILCQSVSGEITNVICSHEALPNIEDCGLNPLSDRIFGGTVTSLDEFPWVVALEFKNRYSGSTSIKCGGSLITKRHILTAGHCVYTPHYNLTHVWLGDWKLSTNPDCITFLGFQLCNHKVQKIKVIDAIHHPSYNDDSLHDDIGLLLLERDATITNFVKPICLPAPNTENSTLPSTLIAVGWGLTENGTSSDIKLKVNLPVQPNSKCESALEDKLTIKQLCVGGQNGKDTCGGDSGGPLMNYYFDKTTGDIRWYLVGIVSFGYECGLDGYPAVYTKVSSYMDWILRHVTASKS